MWIILTTIFFICSCGLGFACYNMVKKIEVYEDWLDYFRTEIHDVHTRLDDVDKSGIFVSSVDEKGMFAKDDDVGFVFSEILRIIREFDEKIK
jgi:transcription elongation factor Elf1